MKLDEKTIMDLAGQLGIQADKKSAADTARRYEQKSDAEIAAEILKLQDKLKAANIPYEKQMAMVQSLMPMMSGEQRARLNKVIGLMKK
ncbi:hypothetical protein ACPW7J_01930 [Ihubacter sp. rT4E-8]|uniref:hypothetical protein n=1 Tax=unclassified Ihubacter TaxID=2633299 RepID=UPI001379AC12